MNFYYEGRRFQELIILLPLIIFTSYLSGQNNFYFSELTQNSGLSELTTSYIFTDSRGFTWIGTRDGLNRFDGKNTKVYRPKVGIIEDPNLSSNTFEDCNSNIWFSTSNAIYYWSPISDAVKSIELSSFVKDTLNESDYHLFHIDNKDSLWFSNNGKLYKMNATSHEGRFVHLFNSSWAYPIVDEMKETVGITQPLLNEGAGIECIKYNESGLPERRRYFSFDNPSDLEPTFFLFYHVVNDSLIWLPSSKGLIKFNPHLPQDYKVYKPNFCTDEVRFNDVRKIGEEHLLVSSREAGLFLFNWKKEKFIKSDSLITVNKRRISIRKIDNIYVGNNDNLWISIWNQGVYFTNLRNRKFEHLLSSGNSNFAELTSVHSIIKESRGNLWCSSNTDGIIILKDTEGLFHKINVPGIEAIDDIPRFFYEDWSNNFWIIYSDKIFLRKKGAVEFELKSNDALDFRQIQQIETNKFLVLTRNELFLIDDSLKKVEFDQITPLLNFENVYLFHVDNLNRIFISDGIDQLKIYKIENNKVVLLKEISHVGYINGLVNDRDNKNIWLASNKGLIKVDGNTFAYSFIQNKKLKKSFNSIFLDEEQNLWLSSNNGIFQYDTQSREIFHYSESDGLPSSQFILGSGFQDKSGQIYFGNADGIVKFYPRNIKRNQVVPKIHIRNIKINDIDSLIEKGTLTSTKKIFPYSQNTLSFYFSAIEYTAPLENQFKFYLSGYDKDTVYNGTEGYARYPNLPSGRYVLNVWASNSDEIWTKQPKQLEIIILSPWYETWWFSTIIGLSIMGGIYGIYAFRINQIQKEAKYKQLVAETETAVLRLQMNPHFIFNSMNSISNFIIEKDLDKAHDFLARLARLMRNILDSSEKQFHSLTAEIDLLEEYMNIEKRRLTNSFQYQIKLENIIDTNEVMIPTMILQPFVENAIWHGVATKGLNGKINIFFTLEKQRLLIIIRDNGLGRSSSSKNKSNVHESKAISITQKRLNLIGNKYRQSKTNLEIKNLYDLNQNVVGTEVILRIPKIPCPS